MKRGAHRALLTLLVLGHSLNASPARAQNASELEALLEEKIVTSASKSAETTDSAPATVTTLTADDLRRHGLRTVADAVRFLVAGANIEETPGGGFGSRGVLIPYDFGSHVLVLIDGHVVNSELDSSASLGHELGVPIELVDHIEVVLGPGSVLYGGNAMFGVINVVTKRARHHRGLHLGVDAEPSRQYRGSASAGAEFEWLGQLGELTFGVELVDMTDPIGLDVQYVGNDVYTGAPLQTRADGSANGLWGGTWTNNFARSASGYSRLTLGDLQLGLRVGRQRTNDPTNLFDFDAADVGYTTRWLSLDLSYQKRLSQVLDVTLRLYGDEARKDIRWFSSAPQYCLLGQLSGCRVDTHGGAEWAGLEAQGRFDWLSDGRQTTLLGVDGRVRNVQYVSDIIDSESGDNPGSVAYYSDIDATLGAYVQHVARPSRALTLNVGTRLDSLPRFGSALSPRAAIVLEPWDGSSLKAIYSSAFQAPLPSTMAFAQPLLIVAAGDLGSERVHAFELAAEQRLSTHRLRTSLFYSRWEDMVELVRLTAGELALAKSRGQLLAFVPEALQYRNGATIASYGYTADWEGSMLGRRLRYGLSVTEAFVRVRHDGGEALLLDGAPQLSGSARLSYDLGEPWPTLALATFATGETRVFGVDQSTYAEPPVAEARVVALANASGRVPALSGLSYRLGARLANHGQSAYPVSPLKRGTPDNPKPLLFPLRTFTAHCGLEYDFE